MIYCIDTNIFLRVFVNEDQKSREDCVKLLGKIKTNGIDAVVPGIVLSEVCWTLLTYYKIPKSDTVRLLHSMTQTSGLTFIENYDYANTIFLFQNHSVKYIDAQIASIHELQRREWAIVSYDKDFDKLGIIRKEPYELL